MTALAKIETTGQTIKNTSNRASTASRSSLREALRLLTYGSTRAILREVDRRLGDVRPRPKNF